MSVLTSEQRTYLRAEIGRRQRIVRCPGCGADVPRTSSKRRYCTVACANRHWHVRKRDAALDEGVDYAILRRQRGLCWDEKRRMTIDRRYLSGGQAINPTSGIYGPRTWLFTKVNQGARNYACGQCGYVIKREPHMAGCSGIVRICRSCAAAESVSS